MTRLDDLLDQLTVDVPEAPSVDELRRRVGSRHRRPSAVAAVLIGLVLVSALFVQLGDERSGDGAPATGAERRPRPNPLPGPRSFEIAVHAGASPVVELHQLELPRWNWIREEIPPLRLRIIADATSRDRIRLTAPTWEWRTDEGVLFLGNVACVESRICVVENEVATLERGESHEFSVYIHPRLVRLGNYSLATEFGYENLTTGEIGTIPVDVEVSVWEPAPGSDPPPTTVDTILLPPPPSPSTTAAP